MSGYAVSETSGLFEDNSQASVPGKTKVLNGAARARKEEPKSNLESGKNKNNLPTLYKEKNVSVVSASQMLADNYPTSYSPENYQKAIDELKVVTKGILAFLFLIYMTWVAVEKTNFTESGELIYNSGLIGGSLMLVSLWRCWSISSYFSLFIRLKINQWVGRICYYTCRYYQRRIGKVFIYTVNYILA